MKISKLLYKISKVLISDNKLNSINSINDLKSFYDKCSYGLIDFANNKPWKEVNGEPTDDDYDNNWKLLSTEQLLKYKCGICFDTAKMNDYFLTKWHIPHINLFAYSKRSLSDEYSDPTHAFTVYKDDDNKWKWIEGSWENYKNNDWSDVSSKNLIKRIGEALAHDLKQTYLIVIIHNFPEAGVNMDEFFEELEDDLGHPIFEIAYKSSYRKSSKNRTASIDIVPIRNENEEDLNLILQGCNLDSIASGDELWSIQDVKDVINGKYKDFFLLHSGDDIIGMCIISGNALSGFAIFPEYQGKGYGKQSLKAIIKKMRETNKEIILRVAVNNTRAVNLYKSLGFEKIENDPYSDGRSYMMVLKHEVKIASNIADDKAIYEIYGAILGCLGEHKYDVDYIVVEELDNDPWEAIIKSSNLLTKNEVELWHKYHVVDVDKKGVPYYFIVKDTLNNLEYVYYSDDDYWIPINTQEEINRAKNIGKKKHLSEEQLDFDSDVGINQKVKNNISDNKVYHGSPFKLDKLLGSKTESWSGEKGGVFVTPFKSLSACFVINKDDIINHLQNQLNCRITNLNFGYDIWNKSTDKLNKMPQQINILLNLKQFVPFYGESTGYIYTIDYDKYKDKTHMFNKNMDSDVEFLIDGDVDYIKCQQFTIRWKCVPSINQIKKHGQAEFL